MGGKVQINDDGTITKVVEEVKIVKIEDKEKLAQLEEQLQNERIEIHTKMETQIKQIENQKNLS